MGGDKVRQEFKSLGKDGTEAFHRITNVITPANDNLKVINETAKTFNSVLKQGVALMGAYLGFQGITNTFKSIVSTNAEFERLSASLKTVTGSVEEAKKAFNLIEDFATSTPYQLDEIVDSFIRLKAMGLEPSMKALTSYGNTASAFGRNILDYVEAVSSATVGEFERLKTFGIKARVEGETVRFIFQGVTTEVAKNAHEIEKYLRSIGDINFGGAMGEQMKTIGGTMSNIEDALAKVSRTIGENGLNQAVKNVLDQFNNMISETDNAAKSIGNGLAQAVNLAGKAFFALANNIKPVLILLSIRLGSATILKTWTLLKGAVLGLNAALIGTGTSSASAILGLRMMWQVSKVTAIQMGATAVAVKALNGAMALLGGPAGVVLALSYGLYKLVDSHDIAKKAANDHADTLQRLKDQMTKVTIETSNFMSNLEKDQAIAEWGNKLNTAESNIKDLREELKQTGGISFWKRLSPNFMLKDYDVFANDLAEILRQSKYNLEEYEREIWKLAAEYPDFQPQATAIQEKLLLLKAAEEDARIAREELKYLAHPELRPQDMLEEQTSEVPSVDTKEYEKNLEDIRKKVLELQSPYDQAIAKAREWRDNALQNLDSTKEGYDEFKENVTQVYDDMIKKANEAALQSSTNWKDGLTRGMQNTYKDTSDMAKATENIVKNSFGAMEDTLTEFVMTGKMKFGDLVNSIVEGMVRMAIQYAVIQPLMGGMMGYFGIPMAHTGGVIGQDTLSSREISPSIFENATRYHTGGLVGNEIPIIAQRGETVFTKGQMQALGTELNSKTPVLVNVNVHNNASGVQATANSSKDANGNLSIDVIVEQIEGTIGKNISKGEGLSPILEQRYALNPAYGSYR